MADWQNKIFVQTEFTKMSDDYSEDTVIELLTKIKSELQRINFIEYLNNNNLKRQASDILEVIANIDDSINHNIDFFPDPEEIEEWMDTLSNIGDISLDGDWNGKKVMFIA